MVEIMTRKALMLLMIYRKVICSSRFSRRLLSLYRIAPLSSSICPQGLGRVTPVGMQRMQQPFLSPIGTPRDRKDPGEFDLREDSLETNYTPSEYELEVSDTIFKTDL